MSPESQWVSTVSMNRFYDHCYLIECAYHIISKYCCSFTNLLNHDDGSIPYYLVQKVKIAVEYGRLLLNTRYRPFQQQLRLLGSFDYIDRFQYEGLCIHWNTIKTETQIVEMYFNQISLLIYPVVSSNALLSLNVVENGNVSALTKINALIQSLVGHDETTICSSPSSPLKNSTRSLNTADATRLEYFSEEELSSFIVNNIIEPLFQDEKTAVAVGDGSEKQVSRVLACSVTAKNKKNVALSTQNSKKNRIREAWSMNNELDTNISDKFHLVASNVLINDLYNLIGNEIFRMDDKLLSEILAVNPFENLTFSSNDTFDAGKPYKLAFESYLGRNDLSKRFVRTERDKDRRKDESNTHRLRYDHHRRGATNQRKYQKRSAINFDKKYPFEFVNKKFADPLILDKNFI